MKIKFLSGLTIAIILFNTCYSFFVRHNFIYAEQKEDKDEKSENIKDKIDNNFKKISSFIVDLNIRKINGENIAGKIFYKNKPYVKMKTIWEYLDGNKVIMYDRKGSQIIYLPTQNIAFKKIIPNDQLAIPGAIILSNINQSAGKAFEDKDLYYYEVPLPMPSPQLMSDEIPVKMKGFINKLYGYTEKIIFINRKDQELEIQEFKNYQLNIPIEDKEFEFVPPKGCQIVSQTESTKGE